MTVLAQGVASTKQGASSRLWNRDAVTMMTLAVIVPNLLFVLVSPWLLLRRMLSPLAYVVAVVIAAVVPWPVAFLVFVLAAAMDVPARLLPVPVGVLEAGAAMLGRRAMIQRLCGDLRVDISKTQSLLGWTPPIGVDEGLRLAAAGFGK